MSTDYAKIFQYFLPTVIVFNYFFFNGGGGGGGLASMYTFAVFDVKKITAGSNFFLIHVK